MSAVTLIDEVNTAGVPSDTDHGRICGARGGLKSPEWIHFCVQHFLCQSRRKPGIGRYVSGLKL